MKTPVTLSVYDDPAPAYFLKERFEKDGIDCQLSFGYDQERRVTRTGIQVDARMVERAVKIMLGIKEAYGKAIEEIGPEEARFRIIVPTDFSKASENACLYAVGLAGRIGAEIKVLHICQNPEADVNVKKTATFVSYIAERKEEVEREAGAKLGAFTGKMNDFMEERGMKNVTLHSAIAMGDVVRRIKSVSKIYRPHLVVLGTVGRESDERSLLGGMVNALIRDLEVPMYVIPGPFAFRDTGKTNILYATDFNEQDNKSLDGLLKIVSSMDTRITCVHVDTDQNPSRKERMDELNEFLAEHYADHEILCQLIGDDDVYRGIRNAVDRFDIHLLSFTTRKRGIFDKLFRPNLFGKILQEAGIPILIFPS